MGQEIERTHFNKHDFAVFRTRLDAETALLAESIGRGALSDHHHIAGFELECWLVDHQFRPLPNNLAFIDRFESDLVSPELAKFNVEFNTPPRRLEGAVLRRMERDFTATWVRACRVAEDIGGHLVMIGILPTVEQGQLGMSAMTPMKRYHALNEQVLRLRRGRPLRVDIDGIEPLQVEHHDVMLEAVTTSFQLHLQVRPDQGARYYNASKIISGPMTAACANSPLLFGHDLWAETRIPVFEQAVAMGYGQEGSAHNRVTFGHGYVQQSLLECFLVNQREYEVLLPIHFATGEREFNHLRLHNGTIWRWNRPLVGFDDDGTPHLRIEHRPLPAGPTIADMLANAALFYGVVESLATQEPAPEAFLPFLQTRANFYACARFGLAARVKWLNGQDYAVSELLREELVPLARAGLQNLELDEDDIDYYLGIISARLDEGQTGSVWQRRFVDAHGKDLSALTEAYYVRQQAGLPVHQWSVRA